jgi:tetratricopeptide (TPR) repeat protein
VQDGESWYILANGYLAQYLSTLNLQHLFDALKSFQLAEQSDNMKNNPDLLFNRAMIYKFLNEYETAYAGFLHAYNIDPTLFAALQCANQIKNLLEKLTVLIEVNGNLKANQLQQYIAKLSYVQYGSELQERPLNALSQENNAQYAVSLIVVQRISILSSSPSIYLALDREKTFCSVVIYHVVADSIKEGDLIVIPNPVIKKRQYCLENRHYSFLEVYVSKPTTILLNKKLMSTSQLAFPTMQLTIVA